MLLYESNDLNFSLKNYELEFLTSPKWLLKSGLPWVMLYNGQTLKLRILEGEPKTSMSWSQKEADFTITVNEDTRKINCEMFSSILTEGELFDLVKLYGHTANLRLRGIYSNSK